MWGKRNEEGDFLQESQKDFRIAAVWFSLHNFSIHTFKIKTYNKCFSAVCNEKPSRLNWATCVAESLFVFLLKKKIVTRENSSTAPYLQWHQADPHSPRPSHSV